MSFLYNIAIYIVGFSLKIIALFNKKIRLFVNGRKDIFAELTSKFSKNDAVLPLDTKANTKKFIEIVNPAFAIFVKYEFWPNFLKQLKSKQIKTILVSGIFRKDQAFFKWYSSWMQKSLQTFDHFFVQNDISKNLLKSIGFENTTISGDTRFDRVFEITKQNNQIDFIERLIDKKLTLVAGSTWKKDEI